MLTINKTEVKNFDMEPMRENSTTGLMFMKGEHYPLLCYISSKMHNAKIVELGARFGESAACLAYNSSNRVYSYDTNDRIDQACRKDNIEFRFKNVWEDSAEMEFISDADIILVDVDPHNGDMEVALVHKLNYYGFKGLLVCDDIGEKHWPDMYNKFWKNVDLPKYDVTDIGHFSGTGIVDFGFGVMIEGETC